MDINEFSHIIKEIKPYTKYVYLHIKGEPLLHNQLGEMLKICKENNLLVNITTNGTLIKKAKNILLQSGCVNQVNISVHSFKEQGDEFQREYLSDIVDFGLSARDIGKPYVVYRMWNGNDGGTLDSLSYDLLKTISEAFISDYQLPECPKKRRSGTLAKNVFINWEDEFVWPSLSHDIVSEIGTCRGTRDMLGILCDGTVVPCCLDSDGRVCLGNIYEMPFEEIILSDSYVNMNKGLLDGKITEQLCQRCSYRLRFDKKR